MFEKLKLKKKEKQNIKPYNVAKSGSKLSKKYIKNRYLDKFQTNKAVIINLELKNGFKRTFLVKLNSDNTFKYGDMIFIIDNDTKKFNLDSKLWEFDFHESLSIPVSMIFNEKYMKEEKKELFTKEIKKLLIPYKKEIPVSEIRRLIEDSGIIDVEMASHPHMIKEFVKNKVTEGVMKAGPIEEFLNRLKFFIIVVLVVSVIHFLLFAWKTGLFDKVSIPGFK